MTPRIMALWVLLTCQAAALLGQGWCAAIPPQMIGYHEGQSVDAKSLIIIPVVVHVLWSNESERISEEQIRSQIEVLNADFNAGNSDLSGVLSIHQPLVASMDIRFELATTDEQGMPSSGIAYREVPPGFGDDFQNGRRRMCYNELGGLDAWCTQCYLNVWVVHPGSAGLAGQGIFPGQIGTEPGQVPRAEDGVYISPARVGNRGTVEAPWHLGRTLTHEVGHYLDLYHLWGANYPANDCTAASCCNSPLYDDLVADTPPQIELYLNTCPQGLQQSCGAPDNYQNFMGLSHDACLLMFTNGQRERARAAIAQYRPGFLAEDCPLQCRTANSPNPEEDDFQAGWLANTLWVELTEPASQLYLIDLLGRPLARHFNVPAGRLEVDVPDLSTGVYVVVVETRRGIYSKKLIIACK